MRGARKMGTRNNNWDFFKVESKVSRLIELSTQAKMLLSYLIFRQGKNFNSHWPIMVMAEDLGVSQNVIDQTLRELKVFGLVTVEKIRVKSSFCNTYRVDPGNISRVLPTPLKPDPSMVKKARLKGAKRPFQGCRRHPNKEKEKNNKRKEGNADSMDGKTTRIVEGTENPNPIAGTPVGRESAQRTGGAPPDSRGPLTEAEILKQERNNIVLAEYTAETYCLKYPDCNKKQYKGTCKLCIDFDWKVIRKRSVEIGNHGFCAGDPKDKITILCPHFIGDVPNLSEGIVTQLIGEEAYKRICKKCPEFERWGHNQYLSCSKIDRDTLRQEIMDEYGPYFKEEERRKTERSQECIKIKSKPVEHDPFDDLPDEEQLLENIKIIFNDELCFDPLITNEEAIIFRDRIIALGYDNQRLINWDDIEGILESSTPDEFIAKLPKVEPIKVIDFRFDEDDLNEDAETV
jgi:hypothetical protein